MIKKILLVNIPRISANELNNSTGKETFHEVYPPLGLLYLSAMVKRELVNVEIQVLDLHFEGIKSAHKRKTVNWNEMCQKKIDEFQPDLIGISVLFGSTFACAKEIGSEIRKKYPEIVLVFGGIHITGISNEKRQLDFCDFVSSYESEYHFLKLIRYLNNQGNQLQGIAVKNNRFLRENTETIDGIDRPADLDSLPVPDFSAIDLKNYYKYGYIMAAQTIEKGTPIGTLLSSRGCVGACKFCSVRSFMGSKIRAHSPERVLQEMDILYNDYGIRHIDFVDDDFTHNKKRAIKIFEGLIERNHSLTWSIGNGIRIGTLDEKMMEKMVASKCTYLAFGVETADPKILKAMKKPLTIKLLTESVKILQKFPEIYYKANFMIGFPGETLEQMEKTFALAEEITIDWCVFSICKPLPGTELYEEISKFLPGIDSDISSDLIDYRFDTSKGMSVGGKSQESIFDNAYEQNLRINFRNNRNLSGKNIPRAVKDFERIVKIANEHAFAWNCLAIGYKALNMYQKSEEALKNTKNIVNKSEYWRDKFEVLDFAIHE